MDEEEGNRVGTSAPEYATGETLGERPTPDRVSNFRTRENRYPNSLFTAMEFWQVKT